MDILNDIAQLLPHVTKANAAAQVSSIETAIGTLPTDMAGIVGKILEFATKFGGIVAVAMLAAGGFGLMTSSGDPEKLMNAKETINNALMGLALIVLSVFILELVGVQILGITYLRNIL